MEIHTFLSTKLNDDVVNQHIIPFAMQKQDPSLLVDIRSYLSDVGVIFNMYVNTQADVRFLVFDLRTHANRMYLSSGDQINHILGVTRDLTDDITLVKIAKRVIGLMTPVERTRFINIQMTKLFALDVD